MWGTKSKIGWGFLSLWFFLGTAVVSHAQEDWKGSTTEKDWNVGALTGLGILHSSVGLTLLGTASRKIVNKGFVGDINDNVVIEAQVGPVFISGSTALFYSAHLRWNFEKDPKWQFYALGGLGGYALSGSGFSPRFGIGSIHSLNSTVRLRAEIAHDLIAFGVNFPF